MNKSTPLALSLGTLRYINILLPSMSRMFDHFLNFFSSILVAFYFPRYFTTISNRSAKLKLICNIKNERLLRKQRLQQL